MKTSTLYQIAIFLLLGALAAVSIGYWQQEQQMHYAHLWIQGLSASRDEAQAKAAAAEQRAADAQARADFAELRERRAEERLYVEYPMKTPAFSEPMQTPRVMGWDSQEDPPAVDSVTSRNPISPKNTWRISVRGHEPE